MKKFMITTGTKKTTVVVEANDICELQKYNKPNVWITELDEDTRKFAESKGLI